MLTQGEETLFLPALRRWSFFPRLFPLLGKSLVVREESLLGVCACFYYTRYYNAGRSMNRHQDARGVILTGYISNSQAAFSTVCAPAASSGDEPEAPGPR